MKKILLSLCAVLALFAACKKDDKTSPSGGGAYFYNLNFGGKDYYITGGAPNYMDLVAQVGGYQTAANDYWPVASLEFLFHDFRTAPHTEVMALMGKTFYFDRQAKIYPFITFQTQMNGTTWNSCDTFNKQFYVQIDSVRYLHPDTVGGVNPIDVYAISGSCNALMKDSKDPKNLVLLKNGKFHFEISRSIFD